MMYLARLPLFVLLIGISGLSMLVPAGYAVVTGWTSIAGYFLLSTVLMLTLTAMLAAVTLGRAVSSQPNSLQVLATVLAVFGILPAALGLPLAMALPDTGMFNSWWEMVSCLTTTGATLYSADMLAPPLHLWRALVGWMGGLFILVTAITVLAPLKVGGFEILSSYSEHDERFRLTPEGLSSRRRLSNLQYISGNEYVTPSQRALRVIGNVAPIYAGLTLILWILLLLSGDPGLIALSRAMGTLSTSGISPTQGTSGVGSGILGEMFTFCFLTFALSRQIWPGIGGFRGSNNLYKDVELRLGLSVVVLVTFVLFVRHFLIDLDYSPTVGPSVTGEQSTIKNAASAIWGGVFNAISFLTTTGWTSVAWRDTSSWSGLQSPGLILAGLAIMGGSIASTAGGVKLLRVYALLRQSQRELERIVHPNSVAGGERAGRYLQGEGAYLAFIFFMLFALSIAVTAVLVSIHPIEFDTVLILSISALTNAGPLSGTIALTPSFESTAGIASNPWDGWAGLAAFPKSVLAGAMIVGRLETLAILALLTPDFWRR